MSFFVLISRRLVLFLCVTFTECGNIQGYDSSLFGLFCFVLSFRSFSLKQTQLFCSGDGFHLEIESRQGTETYIRTLHLLPIATRG